MTNEAPEYKPVSRKVLNMWAWKLQHAHVEAEAAANRWRVRNEELNAYVERNPHLFNEPTYTVRDFKGQDIELSDAMGMLNFWGNELKRIAALIGAERDLRALVSMRPPVM